MRGSTMRGPTRLQRNLLLTPRSSTEECPELRPTRNRVLSIYMTKDQVAPAAINEDTARKIAEVRPPRTILRP